MRTIMVLLALGCSAERPVEVPNGMREQIFTGVRLMVPLLQDSYAADLDGDFRPDNRLESLIWALFAWHRDVQSTCDAVIAHSEAPLDLDETAPRIETLDGEAGQVDGVVAPEMLAVGVAPIVTQVISRRDQAGRLLAEELDIGAGCAQASDGVIDACELAASPLGRELLAPDIGGRLSAGFGFIARAHR